MYRLSINFYSIHYNRLCLYSNYFPLTEHIFFIMPRYQEDIVNYYRQTKLILAR